jgi:uncharacterized protein
MDLLDVSLLLIAGFGAGTINAIAGGGSLITFPSLLAIGLPPISATVTNSISVCPGYIASVYGSRTELGELAERRGRRELLALIPTVVAGTAIGCVLLLASPERAFELVVPFLVLAATLATAFQQRIKALVARRRGASERHGRLPLHLAAGLGAVYGGYFNAALGVMLVAALGLAIDESPGRVNALKNVVSAVVGVGAVLAYSIFGPVDWAAALLITPTTLLGGYAGARLARRLRGPALRWIVVAIGAVVTVVLFTRAF